MCVLEPLNAQLDTVQLYNYESAECEFVGRQMCMYVVTHSKIKLHMNVHWENEHRKV